MNKIELQNNYTADDYGANIDLSEIEYLIYDVVKQVSDNMPNHTPNPEWTTQIKEKIGALGTEKGYEVHSTLHNKEWMYDLLWVTKKDGLLISVNLILESELNHRPPHSELIRDFEKLLIGNAENRVMICFNEGNYDLPSNMVRVIKLFNERCKIFKKADKEIRVLVIVIDDFNGDVVPHIICI